MKSAIAFTLLLLTTPMAMAQACQDGPASTETPRFASPVEGDIVSGFGERRHPILGTNKFHTGVDYAMEFGSPVRAAAAGRVLATGTNEGYGIYIILAHARGYETTYAQLSAIAVKKGGCVNTGDIIGRTGKTSTGPHLHFELRMNGRFIDPQRKLAERRPRQ